MFYCKSSSYRNGDQANWGAAWWYIAGLVGGLAVAHNVEASGWNLQWQTIMLLIAAITFVGIGLCLILPKSLNEAKETANQTSIANELKILASDWQFNRYALATLALNFGQYNFFTFLTAFLTKVLSFAQEAAGSVYSVVQAASAFARPFWGFASDFFAQPKKHLRNYLFHRCIMFRCLRPNLLCRCASMVWD